MQFWILHIRITLADNFLNIPTISCQLTFTLKFVPPVPQVAHGRNMQATMKISAKDGPKHLV